VLNFVKELSSKFKHDHNVSIVGVWHGTTLDKAEVIVQTGFANLGTLDEGWFGKGIYFTSFPEYALKYCKQVDNICLIFCYVIVANPFPIVSL
jgi:hypothetical protein